MIETREILIAIGLLGAIVYATRAGGYLLGLQARKIGALRPILETLPGCAMMAIILPAMREGSFAEIAALLVVVGLMWKTNNVALATLVGLAVLVIGAKF
ncbi:MAG: AzlD domain-containing protein [Pseudomonadota bacterium]